MDYFLFICSHKLAFRPLTYFLQRKRKANKKNLCLFQWHDSMNQNHITEIDQNINLYNLY